MKRQWLAINITENGKYYAYAVPVTSSDNLVSVLARIKNLVSANVFDTKKRAGEVVNCWNSCYATNGCHMFDNDTF